MALNWDSVWPLIEAAGPAGLVIALLVLAFVFLAEFSDLLKNGMLRRIAVVVLSFLFAGAPNGDVSEALKFAIGAVVATLGKLVVDALFSLARAQKAKK